MSAGSLLWVLKAQLRVWKNGINWLMLETECWRSSGNSFFMVISTEMPISCKTNKQTTQPHKDDAVLLGVRDAGEVLTGSKPEQWVPHEHSLPALMAVSKSTQILVFN